MDRQQQIIEDGLKKATNGAYWPGIAIGLVVGLLVGAAIGYKLGSPTTVVIPLEQGVNT